jgi:deoxyribodipyrimidine photo-lyase
LPPPCSSSISVSIGVSAPLIDGDAASNSGNWQWVAGTGADTRPNRTFNPTRQGKLHDPDGQYVRRWVPELASLPTAEIHDPTPEQRRALGYEALAA